MKLYYATSVCSLAVRIILNELNIPCEYEAVHLKTKQTTSGNDYLKINPKGSVPALQLDNHEMLTENAVILQYLADTHHAVQLLPLVGDMARYRTLEWLNFISTDLHRFTAPLFWSKFSDDNKKNLFMPILKTKLAIVENHLAHHEYLMGSHFTLPDSYLFVILNWLVKLKADMTEWPSLSRYFTMMKQRPSVKQSLIDEGIE